MEGEILSALQDRDETLASKEILSDAALLSQKYMSLRKSITDLETERGIWNQRMRSLNEDGIASNDDLDINMLNSKMVDLYKKRDQTDYDVKSVKEAMEQLKVEKKRMEDCIVQMSTDKEQLETSIAEMTEKRNSLEKKLDNLHREIVEAESQFIAQTREVEGLKSTVRKYQHDIQESAKFIRESEKFASHKILNRFIVSKEVHSSAIAGIAFGRGYGSLLTVGEDKKLWHLGLPALNELRSCPVSGIPIGFRVNNEAGFMAITGTDHSMRVINMETGRQIIENFSHTDACTDCQWISKNQMLTASRDRTVKLFDVNRNQVVSTVSVISAAMSVCDTSSPSLFAVACYNGAIRFIDTRTKKVERKIDAVHSKALSCVVPSASKETIFSVGLDNCIWETSVKEGAKMRKLTSDALIVKHQYTRISVDPIGGFLCAGSDNGSVLLFDLKHDVPATVLNKHTSPVTCSAFSGNMLITGDRKGVVAFWN